MDSRLKQEALIEDALRSQPLAPMPYSITANVMARIQKDASPSWLTWKDAALSIAIALSIGAALFAAYNLPPILLAKLHIRGVLLYQNFLVNSSWLIPAALFELASFLFALTLPALYKITAYHGR